MATTIFDWQFIQDVASDLPVGMYSLSAVQVAYLLACIDKSTFRGNWQVEGRLPTDAEWDDIFAFVADAERSIMVSAILRAGFRVFKTSGQSLAPDTYTKITWDSADFDVNEDFDFANNRFIASVEGKYFFSALVRIAASAEHGKSLTLNLSKNGAQISRAATEAMPFALSTFAYVIVEMEVADYVELFGQQDTTVARSLWSGIHTQFSGFFVGE